MQEQARHDTSYQPTHYLISPDSRVMLPCQLMSDGRVRIRKKGTMYYVTKVPFDKLFPMEKPIDFPVKLK